MACFEAMLAGGHANSLGRTVEVVDRVLAEPALLDALFACFDAEDPVVRLRAANALKRIDDARPDLLPPCFDTLLAIARRIDQPSVQWTFQQLSGRMAPVLAPDQRAEAQRLIQHNLDRADDWIVLCTAMDVLGAWAVSDPALAAWLRPRLDRHAGDARKSVAGRAAKVAARLR